MQEPTNSPWDTVQTCFTIANGTYSVSTEGHGGIIISANFAQHILSPEAIAKGERFGGYYCYEEDGDRCIPLRELYDKGIIRQGDTFFTRCYVRSDKPEAKDDYIPFTALTETEQAEFYKEWSDGVNEALQRWNAEYWQAHE